MANTIDGSATRHMARMSRRGVLRAGALSVAAGLVAATPASALAFSTVHRTKEEETMVATATAVRPFSVHIPDEALVDLRSRLAATRWPNKELVADRSQGVQLATIQALARYWATAYDWSTYEAVHANAVGPIEFN